MSNTMTSTRSPSTSISKPDKSKKTSRLVVLRLSPELLARFEEKPQPKPEETPHPPPPQSQKEDTLNTTKAPSPTPAPTTHSAPILKVTESTDATSETNSTPVAASDAATTTDTTKKRKGPAPGLKRTLSSTADSSKPRGKPGPKKKPRLEDGTIDHTNKPPTATAATHKLGPKANQGAINAGLRALDRSGKPCRRWGRKTFAVKSFTGVAWSMPSWKGSENQMFLNGDDSSEAKDISMQSSSEVKPNESDAAMDSNAGDRADPMALSTPAASSPPPMPAQTMLAVA